MPSLGGKFIYDKSPVRVYDVKTKEVIAEYPSLTMAANMLGLRKSTASGVISHRRRNKTNNLGKVITMRFVN